MKKSFEMKINVAKMSDREFGLQYLRALRDFLIQDFYKYLRLNQKGKLKGKIRFLCFDYSDFSLVIISDDETSIKELTKKGYKIFTPDNFYYKNPFNPNDVPLINESEVFRVISELYMDLRFRLIEKK